MVKANDQLEGEETNPFKARINEVLPLDVERNFSGFLVRKDSLTFEVDSQKLLTRIALLKEQLLITKFVGPKPTIHALDLWLKTLNQRARKEPSHNV